MTSSTPPSLDPTLHTALLSFCPPLADWTEDRLTALLEFLQSQPPSLIEPCIEVLWQHQKHEWAPPLNDAQIVLIARLQQRHHELGKSLAYEAAQQRPWLLAWQDRIWRGRQTDFTYSLADWMDFTFIILTSNRQLQSLSGYIQRHTPHSNDISMGYHEEKVIACSPYFWSVPVVHDGSNPAPLLKKNSLWFLMEIQNPMPVIEEGLQQQHPLFLNVEENKPLWLQLYYQTSMLTYDLKTLEHWERLMDAPLDAALLNQFALDLNTLQLSSPSHATYTLGELIANRTCTHYYNRHTPERAEECLAIFQKLDAQGALISPTTVNDPWGFFKAKQQERQLESALLKSTPPTPSTPKARL